MTIKGLYKKVQALNTDKVIEDAFDNTAVELADINRRRMNDGVRSDGSEMPFYSIVSQDLFDKPDGPITLHDTGAFQSAVTATREGSVIHTTSEDPKTELLVEKYGTKIFGTGGEYKKQYIKENLRPALNEQINIKTGLKFGR